VKSAIELSIRFIFMVPPPDDANQCRFKIFVEQNDIIDLVVHALLRGKRITASE
jgi:hypothetical protein